MSTAVSRSEAVSSVCRHPFIEYWHIQQGGIRWDHNKMKEKEEFPELFNTSLMSYWAIYRKAQLWKQIFSSFALTGVSFKEKKSNIMYDDLKIKY